MNIAVAVPPSEHQDVKTQAYTGTEFLDSLRNGREIYIYGDVEKINAFFPASGFIPRFTLPG